MRSWRANLCGAQRFAWLNSRRSLPVNRAALKHSRLRTTKNHTLSFQRPRGRGIWLAGRDCPLARSLVGVAAAVRPGPLRESLCVSLSLFFFSTDKGLCVRTAAHHCAPDVVGVKHRRRCDPRPCNNVTYVPLFFRQGYGAGDFSPTPRARAPPTVAEDKKLQADRANWRKGQKRCSRHGCSVF